MEVVHSLKFIVTAILKLHPDIQYKIFGDNINTIKQYHNSFVSNIVDGGMVNIIISDILTFFKFEFEQVSTHSGIYRKYEEYKTWHSDGLPDFDNIIFRLLVDMKL